VYTSVSQNKEIFLSRCPFVPGQWQEQKFRDKSPSNKNKKQEKDILKQKKDILKQEKDALKQEKDILKQERKF
jgi:hypothetical protein